MDRQGFEKYLTKFGKKPHVVEGLIIQVDQFRDYLGAKKTKGLEEAVASDLHDYAAYLEGMKSGSAKIKVRGLALYYQFSGNPSLASIASRIREQEIAKTRKAFKLKDFRGINQEEVAKLKAVGIENVEQMLEAGMTPEDRLQLASQAGVSPEAVLELVKLSDLARIEGLKSIRARLYYEAGTDTLEKIADWEPEALREMLIEFVEKTGFEGIAPLPKEAQHTVEKARQLPKIVEY